MAVELILNEHHKANIVADIPHEGLYGYSFNKINAKFSKMTIRPIAELIKEEVQNPIHETDGCGLTESLKNQIISDMDASLALEQGTPITVTDDEYEMIDHIIKSSPNKFRRAYVHIWDNLVKPVDFENVE